MSPQVSTWNLARAYRIRLPLPGLTLSIPLLSWTLAQRLILRSLPALVSEGEEDGNIVETTIYSGLSIKNSTSYDIDVGELVKLGPTQVLPADGPQILIVHTHGSEAYTPDRYNQYEESDSYRTEDLNYNVIRVGDELTAALEAQGLSVLHDREIYDYPSYTGSYSRSGAAVEEYLAQYPDIAVVIDLHRDALGDGDVTYKTMAELDGQTSSQLMMLVGTGEGGLSHPDWEQNLRLTLYLQQAVNAKYPTLARPISVTKERYNQHLTTGSDDPRGWFKWKHASRGADRCQALCRRRRPRSFKTGG